MMHFLPALIDRTCYRSDTYSTHSSRRGADYAWPVSTDEEKDPPVPADVEGKIPKKVHDVPNSATKSDSEKSHDS